MKNTIRKAFFGIAGVTYRGGDFSHNLNGWKVTTEVNGRNVTLSIDLSENDEDGKEDHNSVIDVRGLQKDFADLDHVQLHKEKWLEAAIREISKTIEGPALFWLEFRFRDGSKRSAPVLVDDRNGSFWLYPYLP